jgi:MFS family permease
MDRLGRKWAAIPCLVLMSLSVGLIPLTQGFSGMLLVALLGGVGNGFGSGLMLTMGSDLAPDKGTGEVLGLIRMIQDIGSTSGPLLIGVLAQVFALTVSPLVVAGLGLAGAWVLVFRVAETLKARHK